MTGDLYTFTSAVAACPVHSALHKEAEARRTEYDAAIERLDRRLLRQLDLHFSRATRTVTA